MICSSISVKSWLTAEHCCYYQLSSNHQKNHSRNEPFDKMLPFHWLGGQELISTDCPRSLGDHNFVR